MVIPPHLISHKACCQKIPLINPAILLVINVFTGNADEQDF